MRSTTLPAAPVSLRSMASFAIMLATPAVNLFVISYETRAVGRLGSEVLLADAMQTRGDVAGSRWQTMPVPASGSEAHRAIEVKADGQDRVTQGDRSRWGRTRFFQRRQRAEEPVQARRDAELVVAVAPTAHRVEDEPLPVEQLAQRLPRDGDVLRQ